MSYSTDTTNKWRQTVILLLIAQFSFFGKCNKNSTKPCLNGGYAFAVTSNWSTQLAVYNVNDTLMLSSVFSKKLIDQINTNLSIDYTNSVGIGGSYVFYELDSIAQQVKGAVAKFDIIATKGVLNDGIIVPQEQKVVSYYESSTDYSLTLKVVPKTKGIYAIFISNLSSRGLNGKDCTNASFENKLVNTNQNTSLFQYAMGRPPASQYEIDRIYCFRVQ